MSGICSLLTHVVCTANKNSGGCRGFCCFNMTPKQKSITSIWGSSYRKRYFSTQKEKLQYWDLKRVFYIQNHTGCILWVLKESKINLSIFCLSSTAFNIYSLRKMKFCCVWIYKQHNICCLDIC